MIMGLFKKKIKQAEKPAEWWEEYFEYSECNSEFAIFRRFFGDDLSGHLSEARKRGWELISTLGSEYHGEDTYIFKKVVDNERKR
jgi:hypothetical protein